MVWFTMLFGCRTTKQPIVFQETDSNIALASYQEQEDHDRRAGLTPRVVRNTRPQEYSLPPLTSANRLPPIHKIRIDEVITTALSSTKILRSLNAQVLANPQTAAGIFDPAIQATDPFFGVEAALSQFDANLNASINHANNDDVFNNSILGGGATEVVQDLTSADFSLQKIAATGAQYTLRSNITHDSNNNPTSTFPSSFTSLWEAQVRRPLLQGSGLQFNRIAGPNAQPGFRATSGVVISRINNDISIAQFEQGVREFVNEIVSTYWDLYFAYRNFESAKLARDTALETWNTIKARFDNDLSGGEADNEAQAREQYFQFQQQLLAALNGDPRAGIPGVLQSEANLRRLIGLAQSDGRLLCPSEKPNAVGSVFDWNALVNRALTDRVEVRQQLWQIKRRELEVLAARNFLLPRLDAVASFRNNGFGDDLIGGGGRFSSAFSDSISGDHNEWEMGLQLNVPIGYRLASTGVRNAELQLFRERAVLEEQELQIIHDLGSAVRLTEQYQLSVTYAFNRLDAARDTVLPRQAAFEADAVQLDTLLESQRRLADAQSAYYRAIVDLQLAQTSVQRESGQLLTTHAINLNQAPSQNLAQVPRSSRKSLVQSILGQPMDYRRN